VIELLPGENWSEPRWVCQQSQDVEYCKRSDRGADRAERRLRKRVGKDATIEYRAGVGAGIAVMLGWA